MLILFQNYGMYKHRCMTFDDLVASNCSKSQIETNDYFSKLEVEENRPLLDYDREKLGATQIRPQRLKIHLGKCKL